VKDDAEQAKQQLAEESPADVLPVFERLSSTEHVYTRVKDDAEQAKQQLAEESPADVLPVFERLSITEHASNKAKDDAEEAKRQLSEELPVDQPDDYSEEEEYIEEIVADDTDDQEMIDEVLTPFHRASTESSDPSIPLPVFQRPSITSEYSTEEVSMDDLNSSDGDFENPLLADPEEDMQKNDAGHLSLLLDIGRYRHSMSDDSTLGDSLTGEEKTVLSGIQEDQLSSSLSHDHHAEQGDSAQFVEDELPGLYREVVLKTMQQLDKNNEGAGEDEQDKQPAERDTTGEEGSLQEDIGGSEASDRAAESPEKVPLPKSDRHESFSKPLDMDQEREEELNADIMEAFF
jgi:hypothetical protein